MAAAVIAAAVAVAAVLVVALTRSSAAPPPAPLDDTFTGRTTERPQGLSPVLRVGGPAADRAYLRFDLRGRGAIRRAVLRLTVLRGSAGAVVVRRIGAETWGECVTTAADAPRVGGAVVRAAVAPGPGARQIDVTRLVRGGGVVGLALTAPRASAVEIASREAPAGAPQLEVTGSGHPPTPPPSSTGLPAPPAAAVVSGPRDRFGIASGSAIEYEGRARHRPLAGRAVGARGEVGEDRRPAEPGPAEGTGQLRLVALRSADPGGARPRREGRGDDRVHPGLGAPGGR